MIIGAVMGGVHSGRLGGGSLGGESEVSSVSVGCRLGVSGVIVGCESGRNRGVTEG